MGEKREKEKNGGWKKYEKKKNCRGMIYPADFKLKSSRVHKKGV